MKSESGRMKGDLKERTKEFALNIIGLYSQLPKRREAQVLGDQLLRSGTSVGATFGRRNEPSPIRISLARLKVVCRNLRRQRIGWSCWKEQDFAGETNWSL
jgi:hypothetical protein